MKFNPQIHHRKSIRLKGYDYSKAGAYFITICCDNRICRFGNIMVGASLADAQNMGVQSTDAQMILNEYGQIAYNEWTKLTERFSNFELDVFQIMPNHMHGIIVLNEPTVGAEFTPAQNENDNNHLGKPINNQQQLGQPNSGQPQMGQPQGIAPTVNATVGDIVGAYKSLVANKCLDAYKINCVEAGLAPAQIGKLWQRNYYEHIIRDEQSYNTISNYIINNPAKWKEDKFYTE